MGTDDAWSRARPPLSGAAPGYLGLPLVETCLSDDDPRHLARARAVGDNAPHGRVELFADATQTG
ncbi:hypothetical protein [Streptomyces sp. NPDC091217]|uniref:hypothetical protein n=1 Tax=Streptomyces sp. NPDC091217 TaxID=3365975 RepID=UPI003814E187